MSSQELPDYYKAIDDVQNSHACMTLRTFIPHCKMVIQVAPAPSPKAEEEESSLFGALVKTLKENLGISPLIAPEPLAPGW